jgi:hypothetical protein
MGELFRVIRGLGSSISCVLVVGTWAQSGFRTTNRYKEYNYIRSSLFVKEEEVTVTYLILTC